MSGEIVFKKQFLHDVLNLAHTYEKNNWDEVRFAANPGQQNGYDPLAGATALEHILDRSAAFEAVFRLLADDLSRVLMYRLLLFRVLGHLHVRLPMSTPDYREKVRALDALIEERNVGMSGEFPLHRFRLSNPAMECIGHPFNIFNAFVIKQYLLRRPGIEVAVRPGDIVVDGGACLGETALGFSAACGIQGRVLAFEFVKSAIAVAQRNWMLNPELSSRIRLVRHALYDKSGVELRFADAGAGTTVSEGGEGEVVPTLAIDDIKATMGVPRINFIKLDIEGAEESALRGASRTIAQDRPRLAISLYHRLQDFYELPLLLHELNPRYRFAIEHYTIHSEETVLYAWEDEAGVAP